MIETPEVRVDRRGFMQMAASVALGVLASVYVPITLEPLQDKASGASEMKYFREWTDWAVGYMNDESLMWPRTFEEYQLRGEQ